jgi:hypothetical protein
MAVSSPPSTAGDMANSVMLNTTVIIIAKYNIMEIRRDATKAVRRFHQKWLKFLLSASLQTQRRVCHELFDLEQANRDYLDGQFLSVLRRTLEHVIQDIGKSSWSVQRSRRDLRGRTRRCNADRHIRIDDDLQRAISRRLSSIEDVVIDRGEP